MSKNKRVIERLETETARAIAHEWRCIRKALFPEWEGFADWRLALADFGRSSFMAFVDIAAKTVFLREPGRLPDFAYVHILCHAVTESENHSRRWYEQMIATAQKLRSMGREPSALMVESNAQHEVGTPGGSPDLIDWARPVLEIRMDGDAPDGEVSLVPFMRQGSARRKGAA